MKELIDVLTNLERVGYKLSETEAEFFKTETEWIEHNSIEAGIRPLQDNILSIRELKQPNNKKIEHFPGGHSILFKIHR